MFPKKTNPYGQQPPYGLIPGSGGGYAASAAAPARGSDGARFGGNPAHGAVGQYGGAYASVYGAQQTGGFSGKVPGSSGIPNLQTNATTLSESSKFSSGAVGSSLGRLNDDYLATSEYGHKLDQYGADYALERRLYGERSANLGRRDGLTDLDRRYLDHIPGSHQSQFQASSVGHQQPLKAQLQPGSNIRQADYFAGRTASNHQGSQEISSYGRIEADHRNLSVLGSASYGGQQPASLGGALRTNIGSLDYGQGPSSSGYRDYISLKGLHHSSLETDYRDGVLSHVHTGISMVDERTSDRVGYRRELDLRDEERRRDILWERERERERELQELELRGRERDMERGRKRERERERERERGRERERVREKERSRDRRHRADLRWERTPPRALVDRRRSSSIRSEKPLRRLVPRRDPAHRHRSPVKQIKREYICKILPFRLVDSERDYLSLTKRYPRLAIAQDFSKVVLNWPKENLNLSLHTPVSLEHDIHEADDKFDEGAVSSSERSYTVNIPETIFHAKVLLMSGMSKGTFADICSIRSAEERIVHLNNILKFAVFKKDYALSVIGGPWNAAIDGGNPLVDSACLIQTAIRYVKQQVQVDLSKCTHWNHFLEVHYNRVGKDGLFSHKEVTVIFVPNLLECVPSMDLWKNNWIAYRKLKAESEQVATKRDKSSGDAKKQIQVSGKPSQGKTTDDGNLRESNIGHDATKIEKDDTIMDQHSRDGLQNSSGKDEKELEKVEEHVEKGGDAQGITSGNASVDHTVEDKKPIKRKVIKKIVKKVVQQRPTTETSGVKSSQEDKYVVSGSASKAVEEQVQVMTEDAGKQHVAGIINQQPQTKKPGKKKIIRRVVKRKVSSSGSKLDDPAMPAETSELVVDVQSVKNDEGLTEAGKLQTKLAEVLNTSAEEISNQRNGEKIDEGHTSTEDKKPHGDKISDQEVVKQKDAKKEEKNVNKNKDDKEKRNGDPKRDPKQKSLVESKEKKRPDEPPRHPGFILKAKRSKRSKLRSASLSLDGLLNYTTNDIEESVFELSLFAESFSEMLQYRMGCIILSFLEKLHRRYVIKKNQRKRPREEDQVPVINEDGKLSDKRRKITDGILNNNNPLTNDAMTKVAEEKMKLDSSASAHDEPEAEERMGDEDPEYEEDPEEVEIYASDEDMGNTTAEEQAGVKAEPLNNTEAKQEVKEDNGNKEIGKELILENIASFDAKPATGVDKQSIAKKAEVQVGKGAVNKEEKTLLKQKEDEVVDKDLLQAFRYFDQNKVGYIKVEDLGCIVHNLGKCLSNKDVKGLAETAHAESNSARDGRVIYAKLVKVVGL